MTQKHHWLVKTEPGEFSFQDLERDGKTVWDGVRNYQARNNLMAMAVGDAVLVYHSIRDKAVVGLAQVSRSAYPDPKDNPEKTWQVVEIVPIRPFRQPVTLDVIKQTPDLANIALIRQSRLSVMPLKPEEFKTLLEMGQCPLP